MKEGLDRLKRRFSTFSFSSRERRQEPLTPEPRERALEVAKEIIAEGNRLLKFKDHVARIDPKGRALIIDGKKHTEKVATAFKGAELLVSTHEHRHVGGGTYSTQDLYVFYPDRVENHKRNSASEPSEIIREANAEDLNVLLRNIKGSQPRKSEKRAKDQLNIDRIVGASLSYSYPPPISRK